MDKVQSYAQRLLDMLGEDEELDYWIIDKLSKISSNISDVYHHLDSERNLQQKAYPFTVNRPDKQQDPISAESEEGEPAQEALSSAEAGTATQAFSSAAVVDLPPEMDADKGVQPMAAQGTGYEGVEGGGDGSVVPMVTERTPIPTAEGDDTESDYDARLRRVNTIGKWLTTIKEGGGGGGGDTFTAGTDDDLTVATEWVANPMTGAVMAIGSITCNVTDGTIMSYS